MAYFSNGSEGADYQARYCERCWHDRHGDCPVWTAHLLYVGEPGKQEVLDELIPRTADGGAGACRLFVPNDPVERIREASHA